MSILTDLRTDVVDALVAAGIKAIEYVGETIVPPTTLVIPADPYIEPGERFGEYNVGINVLVIGGKGTNKAAAEFIDSQIENVISALSDWDITSVAQPQEINLKGIVYLASVVTIETQTNFKEGN